MKIRVRMFCFGKVGRTAPSARIAERLTRRGSKGMLYLPMPRLPKAYFGGGRDVPASLVRVAEVLALARRLFYRV